jgi:enamine deaminase RidA (YjgF/YER057c/UK114 family)
MKKNRFFVLAAALIPAALVLCAACGVKPQASGTAVPEDTTVLTAGAAFPDFVNQAYMNASEDVLVGAGAYPVGSDPVAAQAQAELRALADIGRQLEVVYKGWMTPFSENSGQGNYAFSPISIGSILAQYARVVRQEIQDGALWVVMEYRRSEAAQAGMEAAFNTAASAEAAAFPDFVNQAYMDASESVFVGVGAYPVGSDIGAALAQAELHAMLDICRQLAAVYEIQGKHIPQIMTGTFVTAMPVRGAKPLRIEIQDGALWVVMEYMNWDLVDVDPAEAAAKLAVPEEPAAGTAD